MYAPSDDWGGTYNEWIELYNNDMETINLADWKIDEKTIPETIIQPGEYLIIARNDTKFKEFYPNVSCDVVRVAIQLNNAGEFICIRNSSLTSIDCVNYSSTWGADGNGNTLEKINPNKGNTKDNWNESKVLGGTPGMKNSVNDNADPNIMPLYVNVIGSIPSVNNITISPDYYDAEGFQIMPNAGENKEITISAIIGDDDTINDIVSVTATINSKEINLLKKESINEYEAIYEGKTNMSFYDLPGAYTAEVKAVDNSSLEQINTTEFNYLELLAVDISSGQISFDSLITGTNNTLTGNNGSTIRNIGNIISDIEISGTDLTNGKGIINISNLQYKFGASSFAPLLNTPTIADINLSCSESSYENMNLMLYIPEGTEKGDYTGSITMTAIAD